MSSPRLEPEVFARDLEAARAGCREALGRLRCVYHKYLEFVLHNHTATRKFSRETVVDILQEVYLRAVARFDQFRGNTDASLRGWMRRILVNVVADFYRNRAQHTVALPAGREPPVHDSLSFESAAGERCVALQKIVAQLSPEQQQLLQLRGRDRMTWEQVGTELRISAEAARKAYHRLVRQIIDELE